jgi:hypothetical protein
MADAIVEKLALKAGIVKRVFATPDGQALLEILRTEFLNRLEAKEPHQIIFNAGRADVVAYLMQLQNINFERR